MLGSAKKLSPRLAALSPQRRELLLARLQEQRAGHEGPRRALSRTQFGIWLFEELRPGTAAYNNPAGLRLRGPLDTRALHLALHEIQHRHGVLRSRYPADDDGPYALIARRLPLPFRAVDLSLRPDAEAWLGTLAANAAAAPFDLGAGPVWRLLLLKLASEDHVLVIVMHHIVSDGWSLGVLAGELRRAYGQALAGEAPRMPPLDEDYFSVVARRERELERDHERLTGLWRKRLAGFPREISLPRDEPRADATATGATVPVEIAAPATAALERLCARRKTTLFVGLVAALGCYLRLCTGRQRILFTTPISGREDEESASLIGCFLNTVPLALDLEGAETRADALDRAHATVAAALAGGRLPFADIVAAAGARAHAEQPLGNVMLLQNNAPLDQLDLAGLDVERHPLPVTAVKHDWAFSLARTQRGVTGELEYRRPRFSEESARRTAAGFAAVARALGAGPGRRLDELDVGAGAAGNLAGRD